LLTVKTVVHLYSNEDLELSSVNVRWWRHSP